MEQAADFQEAVKFNSAIFKGYAISIRSVSVCSVRVKGLQNSSQNCHVLQYFCSCYFIAIELKDYDLLIMKLKKNCVILKDESY
jgi:hypothetical protein